jgi:hypothetical protein
MQNFGFVPIQHAIDRSPAEIRSACDWPLSACPAFAAMDVPPQRGPTANRDPKGVQRRTWTPKGSNGEHGPQGGPTANMDPKGVQRQTWTPRGSNGEHGPDGDPPSPLPQTQGFGGSALRSDKRGGNLSL